MKATTATLNMIALVKQLKTEADASKRAKAMVEAEKILMDDQGVAPFTSVLALT